MSLRVASALVLSFLALNSQRALAKSPPLNIESAAPIQNAGTAHVSPAANSSQHALDKDDLSAWLDGFVPYALKSGDIAGAVIVVVDQLAVDLDEF